MKAVDCNKMEFDKDTHKAAFVKTPNAYDRAEETMPS